MDRPDAAPSEDASLFVEAPPCETAAGGPLSLAGDRIPAPTTQQDTSVSLWRIRSGPDGAMVILHSTHPTSIEGFLACRHVLTSIDPSGVIVWSREIAAVDPCIPYGADFALVSAGWQVFGIASAAGDSWRWSAVVALDGAVLAPYTVLETVRDRDVQRLSGVSVVQGSGGADAYFVRDGMLVARRGEADVPIAPLSLGDRIAAMRSADGTSTCIVVRQPRVGDLSVLRLSGDTVVDTQTILAAGASFNPLPIPLGDACLVPFYAPDELHPAAGSVRVWNGDGSIVGWRGLAPLGLSLVAPDRLAIAAPDPVVPDQIDVWWVRPSESTCSVPAGPLSAPIADYGGPLGSVLAADTMAGTRVVLGGLTAIGEVAIASPGG